MRSGDDSNIDIRYRGEPGRMISGTAKFSGTNGVSVTLAQAGSPAFLSSTFQAVGSRGFAFHGIGDGDYELIAQESLSSFTAAMSILALSESKRVTVKGADVTGIELVTRPLGSISGKILVESSKVPECEGKRAPLLTETIVRLQRPEKDADKEDLFQARMFISSASPDASGAFVLRNVVPGKYLTLIDAQASPLAKLRLPESAPTRTKLHRAAEAKKNSIELKPCQNLMDYQPKQ